MPVVAGPFGRPAKVGAGRAGVTVGAVGIAGAATALA